MLSLLELISTFLRERVISSYGSYEILDNVLTLLYTLLEVIVLADSISLKDISVGPRVCTVSWRTYVLDIVVVVRWLSEVSLLRWSSVCWTFWVPSVLNFTHTQRYTRPLCSCQSSYVGGRNPHIEQFEFIFNKLLFR